jgi:hypothetical protein
MAVTTGDLEVALTEALGVAVELVERRPGLYRSSYEIEEIDVTAGGKPLALIFKNVGSDGLSAEARAAKPEFLLEPRREIDVYHEILRLRVPDAPVFHGAIVDPERGRYWLFLERLDATPLHEIGDLEWWHGTVRWLARLHADCGGASVSSLIRYDEGFYSRWLERARGLGALPADPWLERQHRRAVERLMAARRTFIHGEFYASNVLVGTQEDGSRRISPVDWEMAAFAPGVVDLAALTAGGWSEDERRTLALSYLDESRIDLDERSFLEELVCARLHIAVQWLGWSPSWSPPPDHRQDWLAEASLAADRLGL